MCDAVAACHDQQVYHRDIALENFMVMVTPPYGNREPKVVVKLIDFGLSTKDIHSSDMNCGRAPYMSYGMNSLSSVAVTISSMAGSQNVETMSHQHIVHVRLTFGL
jgi:serine/threonine protein kinase